jgi:hypothetical protein
MIVALAAHSRVSVGGIRFVWSGEVDLLPLSGARARCGLLDRSSRDVIASEGVVRPVYSKRASDKPTPVICSMPSSRRT